MVGGEDTNPRYSGQTNVAEHKLDGRPWVQGVKIVSAPTRNETYVEGETIRVRLAFDQEVDVEGSPMLYLDMSHPENESQAGALASYESGTGTAFVTFSYVVGPDDKDTNGIRVRLNGFDFNIEGGTFKAEDTDVEYDPRFLGLLDASGNKVDGPSSQLSTPPTITSVAVTSVPGNFDTYNIGDEIEVTVTFSEEVAVVYKRLGGLVPKLAVEVGDDSKIFPLEDHEGADPFFRYIVRIGDEDPDGIAIGADMLQANDAIIRDADQNSANFSHEAVADDSGHKVLGALGVPENSPPGTSAGTPDELSAPYSISGDDAEYFEVNSETGEVLTTEELDYETKNKYTLQWTGNGIPKDLDIYVINADDPGVVTLSADFHLEGTVLTAEVSDEDGNVSNIQWQWQGSFYSHEWFDAGWARNPLNKSAAM